MNLDEYLFSVMKATLESKMFIHLSVCDFAKLPNPSFGYCLKCHNHDSAPLNLKDHQNIQEISVIWSSVKNHVPGTCRTRVWHMRTSLINFLTSRTPLMIQDHKTLTRNTRDTVYKHWNNFLVDTV